jgi:hypothetical protein
LRFLSVLLDFFSVDLQSRGFPLWTPTAFTRHQVSRESRRSLERAQTSHERHRPASKPPRGIYPRVGSPEPAEYDPKHEHQRLEKIQKEKRRVRLRPTTVQAVPLVNPYRQTFQSMYLKPELNEIQVELPIQHAEEVMMEMRLGHGTAKIPRLYECFQVASRGGCFSFSSPLSL